MMNKKCDDLQEKLDNLFEIDGPQKSIDKSSVELNSKQVRALLDDAELIVDFIDKLKLLSNHDLAKCD